jgi:hypothetical protein
MASVRKAALGWADLLGTTRQAFSGGGFGVFTTLMPGWVLAPGRRTITAMIGAADPEGRRAHDAYHRFVRCGRWSAEALWRILVVRLVGSLAPEGAVPLDVDDTLYKKTGRKVDGAGVFRDAVRSTRSRVVYALGLNLVVVTLRVAAPWGGCPLGLPVRGAPAPQGRPDHHRAGRGDPSTAGRLAARTRLRAVRRQCLRHPHRPGA